LPAAAIGFSLHDLESINTSTQCRNKTSFRCSDSPADANKKNNPENILIDAKQMFDFNADTPFDTSF
jgi:hypothetical protein